MRGFFYGMFCMANGIAGVFWLSKGMGVTCALCWATAIFLVAMAISEA